MTISLHLSLIRPDELCGLKNNLRALDVLAEKLDGVCMPTGIKLDKPREVGIFAEFELRDDLLKDPVTDEDEDEAFEWALDKFSKDVDWKVASAVAVQFEPDEPACSEKESKDMKSLGVRPFSE